MTLSVVHIEAKTAKELVENVNRYVSYKTKDGKTYPAPGLDHLANEPYVEIMQDLSLRWHAFLGFDIQVTAKK